MVDTWRHQIPEEIAFFFRHLKRALGQISLTLAN